jgi:hypothetical protein
MDTQNIIHSFLHSTEGRQAAGALESAGFEQSQISQILHHAAHAGIQHIEADAAKGGILGEHAGMSFFAAFASGLLKGDGMMGSLEDGAAGIVVGRITETLTSAVGLDSGMADAAAAATAPYVMAYLKKHLGI